MDTETDIAKHIIIMSYATLRSSQQQHGFLVVLAPDSEGL